MILLNIDLRIAQVRPRVEKSVQRVLAHVLQLWAYSPITVRHACDWGMESPITFGASTKYRASLVSENALVLVRANNRSRCLFCDKH
jgi:hypothetical protein